MMPYYPEDQSQENIKKLRHENVCAECGRQLYAYLDIENKLTYLACPTPGHEGIAKEYQPAREDYQSNVRRLHEMEQEHGRETALALQKMPAHGQLTQSQAMHILKLVYPKAPEDEVVRCALLCRDFGLHPLMKEVYPIPFNVKQKNGTYKEEWATVVGIAANRKMAANKKGAFSYIDDTPRAATHEEIVKQFGEESEEERDNLISICKVQGEKGNDAVGFGLWPKDKTPYGMDKGNTKRNMANIRAERQALDRLPGEPLPIGVEVVDEAYAEIPEIHQLDAQTGEIIELGKEQPSQPETPPEATESQIEPVMLETPLVSEQYGFGGTIDFFGNVDDQPTLLDFKTGKAIYPEFFYQLAAYEQLLAEAKQLIEVSKILRIGRTEDEGFEERTVGKLDKQWEIFLHCLSIYNLQKEARKEK